MQAILDALMSIVNTLGLIGSFFIDALKNLGIMTELLSSFKSGGLDLFSFLHPVFVTAISLLISMSITFKLIGLASSLS